MTVRSLFFAMSSAMSKDLFLSGCGISSICGWYSRCSVIANKSIPSLRALRDGIDLLAITEHLEYQPHIDDIPHPDRNRSFDIAEDIAKNKDLTVINGAEITRMFPPGHINAIFIEDANKLIYLDEAKISEASLIFASSR